MKDSFSWKGFKKALGKPAVAAVLIGFLVIGIVLFVRARGWLQRPELIVRDYFVNKHADLNATDERIVIVGMTEDDLKEYGFPLSDELLLKVLQTTEAQGPVATGLDLYRDLPEPRVRRGSVDKSKETTPFSAIGEAMRRVAIFTTDSVRYKVFGEGIKAIQSLYVIERFRVVDAPPPFLDVPERISANNLPKDGTIDGVFRRAPLLIEKSKDDLTPSFSLALAVKYLESKEIKYGYEEAPGEHPGEVVNLLRLNKTLFPRLTSNAGAYVNLPVADYEYLVDFQAPRKHRVMDRKGTDPQYGRNTPYDYSVGEVLKGELPPGALTGKIVLLATVMQSIKDSNPTPIHENLRGVQYHAMLIHQLLDAAILGKAPMTWWSDWAEAVWIAGCTLLGGVVGYWLRSPLKLVPGLGLILGGIFFAAQLAFEHGLWILVAAPSLGCLLSAALVTSYIVSIERANRNAVQSILGKHVSKKVAAVILQHQDEFLEGGKMPALSLTGTVIFTDLAGFSTASEKLTAVQTMTWLNAYMDVMARLVETYDGSVNKYIGDAIMGTFGAPIVSTDQEGIATEAAKAVRCALHMRKEVPILNEQWRKNSPDMPPVAMRVGIFTGPLVSGSFGTADRMEWTVIGDTVNRANRLESAGKEIKDQLNDEEKLCSILIGPETFERVGHLFETVPVPGLALKGISERVTVYRVLSERVMSPTTTK